MTMITATELQQKITNNEDFILIDVREEFNPNILILEEN